MIGIPARYVVAILGSIAMGIIYGLKVNFHVTIVNMVNHTAVADAANETHVHSEQKDGPFVWDKERGILLSAYFWGYLVSLLPGGWMAQRFSAKWVMLFAVASNVFATLLTPVMAKLHWVALIIMRILEGIGGGVSFPAAHVLLSSWSPPAERSVMSSIVYSGTALGTVIYMIFAGIIAEKISWEMVFYIQGGASAPWILFWIFFASDNPNKQRFISQEEREMIMTSLGQVSGDHKHEKPPFKAILTSVPFWAIFVAHVCSNWGFYMVLIELPSYMNEVLKFNLSENAGLLALPFLLMWLFSVVGGKVLDFLRGKKIISTTTARKIATAIASAGPAICFIFIIYFGKNKTVAMTLMTIATTAIGGMYCGFLSNHIDICPKHAGLLVAMTNTIGTISGISVPIFVTWATFKNPSGWDTVFWSTIGAFLIEFIVYTIFGSGEEQPWSQSGEATSSNG